MRLAIIGGLLFCIAGPASASPFVNITPHPEIAALRPVTPPETPANNAAAAPTTLPAVVLNFVSDAPDASAAGVQFADTWDRVRAGFRIPGLDVKEVMESTAWYAARPELVTRIFERSRTYLFHIIDEIEKRGMPAELALLPFVESGFNPFALSSAQASGLWQFIPGTATRYNLAQNNGIDARRDIVASTSAALDYLQFLHNLFGDWHLALAAYNWGENQVARAVERNRARGIASDFASLVLPPETRNYVPRLLAVKRIVSEPTAYGIALPAVPNQPYFTAVPTAATMDVSQAARFAGLDVEEFRALNPAHNHTVINASIAMPLLIPADRAQAFAEKLDEHLQQEEARRKARAAKSGRQGIHRQK